jgi:large subunit ribosomal protein L31e
MAADKKTKETKEAKIVLERVYNVPLRKGWLKAPRHKRAKKAVRTMREFLAQHMKTEFGNVRIGMWANEHLWAQGTKKPPHHIQVKVTKDSEGIVRAELVELTLRQKIMQERSNKQKAEQESKGKKEEKKETKTETKAEAKKEEEKKEELSVEKKEEKEVMKQEVIKHEASHSHETKKVKGPTTQKHPSHDHNK